ncbi:MAG: bifunctional hydroxymethylpyrimidine kinase/phosphomethylpyrimidine kinase [Candidatus Thermoplasmatota archaeon]|jgi:hydroxymethylpyrimidine/phosphomethylpyrimidine kinase|nr:bifunctional hydroxymethylpyrimidine kinase/phosphomethylpyrimidine kinase [Candidatus Thermoplasmatota archaeon]
MKRVPRALTIAGSDSGGGAGIQADLKTMTSLSVFGSSVIVALTAQNSVKVSGIYEVAPDFIISQIDAVLSDMGADSVKTGMLYSSTTISAVSRGLREYAVSGIIIDPVMISKTGAVLLRDDAISEMIAHLFPLAALITPNAPEAERISGQAIGSSEDAMSVSQKLSDEYGIGVLIKGGHLAGETVKDFLTIDGRTYVYSGKRVNTENSHGTGDTLSAAICSYLALGNPMLKAVELSRTYLQNAIEHSFPMGKGYGSLNHFWRNIDE